MDNSLYLWQAFDALFPIGAYTLSNGLETYVQRGLVRDPETLRAFIQAYLALLPYGDLGLAARAAEGEDPEKLDRLCHIMKAPAEVRQGSQRLGIRFLKAQAALHPYAGLSAYAQLIRSGRCRGHYPVAVGLFIRDLGAAEGLNRYAYSLLSALVNHAAKLVPLRQLQAQAVLYAALEQIPTAVAQARRTQLEDLGVSGVGFDLRAMQHETLYSRLYSS
jgi:urease accessory protein